MEERGRSEGGKEVRVREIRGRNEGGVREGRWEMGVIQRR